MRPVTRTVCAALLTLAASAAAAIGQEMPEIFMAILDGDAVAVEAQLDAGADPNMTFEERTPLMFAVWRERMDMVELLVERGADLHLKTALGVPLISIAAEVGDTAILAFLLARGADIDARGTGIRATFDGETDRMLTPLIVAIRYAPRARLPSIVQFLIDHGADIDARDGAGWTPLMRSVRRADLGTLQTIIDAGADLSLRNNDGETALDRARQLVQDPPVIANALIAAGAG